MKKLEQFVVKSRTGKMYTFQTIEEAKEFASKRSTSTRFFTVYSEGAAIAAFANHKQLETYQTVWEFKPMLEDNHQLFTYENWWGEEVEKNKGCVIREIYYNIGTTANKVRVQIAYQVLTRKNGIFHSSIQKKSLTYRGNGTAMLYQDGKVQYTRSQSFGLPENGNEILSNLLKALRPELCVFQRVNTMIFTRPNARWKIDVFNNTVSKRPFTDSRLEQQCPAMMMDENELIDMLAKRNNVPLTKAFRKIYAMDASNVFMVRDIMNLGFRDANNVQKLSHIYKYLIPDKEQDKQFFATWLAVKGENYVTKILSTQDLSQLQDTCIIAEHLEEDILQYVLKEAKNVTEIHDSITRFLYRNRYMNNISISYTQEERKLEGVFGRLKFILPKDARQLAVVGARMGICVGGYAHEAAAKRCTIVYAMDGSKYAACLEIIGNKLVQLKSKCNNPVSIEYKSSIDKWAQDNIIERRCQDYLQIGYPQWSNHHYNIINPDDIVDNDNGTLVIVKRPTIEYHHVPGWYGYREYMAREELQKKLLEEQKEEAAWIEAMAAKYNK